MSAPPVPPRPPTTQPGGPGGLGGPPPLPPFPPGFRPDIDSYRESPPRFGDPMLAPKPQKLLSSVPADVSTPRHLALVTPLHPLLSPRCYLVCLHPDSLLPHSPGSLVEIQDIDPISLIFFRAENFVHVYRDADKAGLLETHERATHIDGSRMPSRIGL
jgi:hypothetical protein